VNATPLTAPDGWVVIADAVAAPKVSANEPDVIAVSDVGVNVKVKFPAVPVITRFVKVATPLDAATVVVPESVPVPDAIVATTFTDEFVTVFPPESTMRTTGCCVNATPLTAPLGWVVIADAVAAPKVSANEPDVIAVNEVGVNVKVKFPTVPVITRFVNVATPLLAATVVVPESVPVPDAIVATTFTDEFVTVLPLASTIRTTGCCVNATPFTAPDG
jgi:hypothetical protein